MLVVELSSKLILSRVDNVGGEENIKRVIYSV